MKKKYFVIVISIILIALLLGVICLHSKEKIIAKVNGSSITERDLDKAQEKNKKTDFNEKEILENLIRRELINQYANSHSIPIDEKVEKSVRAKINKQALQKYRINELVVDEKTAEFIGESSFPRYNSQNIDKLEDRKKAKNKYYSNAKKQIEKEYFSIWIESLRKKANIEVAGEYKGKLFKDGGGKDSLESNPFVVSVTKKDEISYTPVRHGIIDYYYPEGTVVEEEWDYSKAKKYLGVDFLKKIKGFEYTDEGHDDLFTLSVRNKTPYWTITRDKKTNKILLDNFGMVYKGKNNKEIVVAVAKGKFPFLYDDIEFEDAKMSYINGYPMYLGENPSYNESLYAKFSKDNICYIIWTQYMSKDELQELVKQYLS